MLKSKTKLQIHTEKKKELGESIEYLKQVENPESQGGGRKYIHDTRLQEKKDEKKKNDETANWLENQISHRIGYRRRLAEYAELESWTRLDSREGWIYNCLATSGERIKIYGKNYTTREGVVHVLKSPKGDVFIRAVGVNYNPEVDISNIHTMFTQAQNTIDSAKGLLLSDNKDTAGSFDKKSGIWLPN